MEPRQVFGAKIPGYEARALIAFCPRCGSACEDRVFDGVTRSVCSGCSYVHFVNPAPGVVAMVVEGNKVLLGKRARGKHVGKWCLPGGYVEYHEDFLTAMLREIGEETGLQAELTGLLSVCSNYLDDIGHTLVVVLLARPIGGTLQAGDDAIEVGWFTADALPELAFEADAHIIARYFESPFTGAPLDPRYVRLQEGA